MTDVIIMMICELFRKCFHLDVGGIMFKTGELSKVFEIDRTSVNHYVKMGLLDPEVQENQYYQYSHIPII